MDDLISRQAAIDAVEHITSSMSVCVNSDECHGMKRMQRQAVIELANLPSAQQWIPCSERLPEEGIVLVTYRDRDIDILRYPTAYRKYDIIAWMPIEPWRGEDHETD